MFDCINCQVYNVTTDTKKKFCDHSCAAIYNNSNRVTDTFCLRCGKNTSLEKNQKLYCSTECSVLYRKEKKIQEYLDGTWDATTASGLSHSISIYLKEQAGWKCQSPNCLIPGGWGEINPVTGKSPVEIDHIDGNSFNNRPENLTVLCPNCHSLTPTYKALNKKSGRTYRSRYAQYETLTLPIEGAILESIN
jgi:hypothetical protein